MWSMVARYDGDDDSGRLFCALVGSIACDASIRVACVCSNALPMHATRTIFRMMNDFDEWCGTYRKCDALMMVVHLMAVASGDTFREDE